MRISVDYTVAEAIVEFIETLFSKYSYDPSVNCILENKSSYLL